MLQITVSSQRREAILKQEKLYLQTMKIWTYLQYNKEFYSIPKGEDPHIGINRAVDILSQPKKKGVLADLVL